MKELLFILILAVLVACAAPAPEGEEAVTTDEATMDVAATDEVEGEEDEAADAPPEGALPLMEILTRLEAMGYTEIIESDFQSGAWEIECVVNGEGRELRVDPMTGEILSQEPEEDDDD